MPNVILYRRFTATRKTVRPRGRRHGPDCGPETQPRKLYQSIGRKAHAGQIRRPVGHALIVRRLQGLSDTNADVQSIGYRKCPDLADPLLQAGSMMELNHQAERIPD